MLASGTAPDAFLLSWAYFGEFAKTEALLDLSPMLTRDWSAMRASDIFPAALESAQYRGKQLGIPLLPGHSMMYHNEELLQRSGLDGPRPNWSWDDFLDYATKVTQRSGAGTLAETYGIDALSYWGIWSSILFSQGGSFWDESYDDIVINSPAGRRTFQFVCDLIHEYQVAPPAGHGLGNLWNAGKLGFTVAGSALITNMQRDQLFDFGLTNYPKGPHGQYNPGGILAAAGNAATKHPEATWSFLKFLLSPAIQELRNEFGNDMPVRASALRRIADPLMRSYGMGIEYARVWTNQYYSQLDSIVSGEVSGMLRGMKSVEAGLDGMNTRLRGYLSGIGHASR